MDSLGCPDQVGLGGFGKISYFRDMKRLAVGAVLAFLTGCSNAPIAGFLDLVHPTKTHESNPPARPRDPIPPGDRIPPPDLGPLGPPVGPAPKQ